MACDRSAADDGCLRQSKPEPSGPAGSHRPAPEAVGAGTTAGARSAGALQLTLHDDVVRLLAEAVIEAEMRGQAPS